MTPEELEVQLNTYKEKTNKKLAELAETKELLKYHKHQGIDTVKIREKDLTEEFTKIRVTQSGNVVVADQTYVKSTLDTITYDVLDEFDTTNNRFVATKAGYYLVCGAIYYLPTTADKLYVVQVYKNGTGGTRYGTLTYQSSIGGGVNHLLIPIIDLIYMDAGDYLELYAYHYVGANQTMAANFTFLSIHQLS